MGHGGFVFGFDEVQVEGQIGFVSENQHSTLSHVLSLGTPHFLMSLSEARREVLGRTVFKAGMTLD